MAFFVTKSMTNIFSVSDNEILLASDSNSWSDLPTALSKSDAPLIAAAIDGHFSSEWESRLYHEIYSVFANSMLDESVPIGTVVLLDLLSDLYKKGRSVDGERFKLVLPSYPHEDYISIFMGAFMLAYRLLSRNKPVKTGYWKQVLGKMYLPASDDVTEMENNLRTMLEANINYYSPPVISLYDHAYCAEDLAIPSNAFIARLRYTGTKSAMYCHIRLLMTSRGEEAFKIYTDRKQEVPALQFPPCVDQMINKMLIFAETRKRVPQLRRSTVKEIHDYLESKAEKKLLENQAKGVIGLGLVIDCR